MLNHNLLHDRQADARARFAGLFRALRAIELLKDLLHFFLIHADAFILHLDANIGRLPDRRQRHVSARRRVFNRVGQQVVEGIFQ